MAMILSQMASMVMDQNPVIVSNPATLTKQMNERDYFPVNLLHQLRDI